MKIWATTRMSITVKATRAVISTSFQTKRVSVFMDTVWPRLMTVHKNGRGDRATPPLLMPPAYPLELGTGWGRYEPEPLLPAADLPEEILHLGRPLLGSDPLDGGAGTPDELRLVHLDA